jgi:hypothetical protein
MDLRGLRSTIVEANLNEDVLGRFLRIFHEHVEVPVLVENSGIDQLIFELLAAAPLVGFDQLLIRIGGVWILVEILHVGVRRRAVQVEVIFLHVLAMIALAVCQTKQPFLQDRVFPIPKRHGKAEQLLVVRNACEPVFAPMVGA